MAKVYLDACIVVYVIQGPESISRTLRAMLQSDEIAPCVSDLTRLECRAWPLRRQQPGLSDRFLEEIETQLALIRDHPLAFSGHS